MPSEARPLPKFDKPPVIETVLGVEFPQLAGWQVPHFGLYWNSIRNDFPKFEVQPAIVESNENRSQEDRILKAVLVDLLPHPPVRCWYVHESDSRLIQVQHDRFIHNWRKEKPSGVYPTYDNIRPMFAEQWQGFLKFLHSQDILAPEPTRCEVTYINQLERGNEWQSTADLKNVIALWAGGSTDGFLPTSEAAAFSSKYAMPEERGFLSVQISQAIRKHDRKDVLQLTITAKVKPTSSATEDVLQALDLGHEWVVRSFADVTTAQMHKLWGRTI